MSIIVLISVLKTCYILYILLQLVGNEVRENGISLSLTLPTIVLDQVDFKFMTSERL